MRQLIVILSLVTSTCFAASIEIPMHEVAQVGHGKSIGTITAVQTDMGVLFKPQLNGLKTSPVVRGFHVHAGSSCDNFAQAAQGHLDPKNTNQHLGPYDKNGHLGDIQGLIINSDGTATLPVLAPKLMLKAIVGRTLVIHAKGDNYSYKPDPMGGGGDRIACGMIPTHVNETAAAKKPVPKPVDNPPSQLASEPTPTSDAKSMSTNQQIQQLLERKKKLQNMQQQSREQLQNLQKQQAGQ